MDSETGFPTESMRWRIRVRGIVGPVEAHAFRGFTVRHHDAVSTLEGTLVPGTGLGSLLVDLQSLGLEVIALERIEDQTAHGDQ